MRKTIISLLVLLLLGATQVIACSACKITINGRTYFLNNEDNWRLGSRIWFEPGKNGQMGSAFFGYSDGFPQGGMNEAGLAFDGLTVYRKQIENKDKKPVLGDRAAFVRNIMATCKTVDEVSKLANSYFRAGLNAGIFFFADKQGNYAVVEPDTVILGSDRNYVVANYCPSTTPEEERMKFTRYANGKAFVGKTLDSNDNSIFRRALDTMHVCRGKIGDGTLHSYIADLSKGTIELFFYHDYTQSLLFDLKTELAKGENAYDIASLFPSNKEYTKLLEYKTVYNDKRVALFVSGAMGVFSIILIWNAIALFRRKAVNRKFSWTMFLLALVTLPMLAKLIMDQAIFYFPFPYNGVLNPINYLPILSIALTVLGLYIAITRTMKFKGSIVVNAIGLAMGLILAGLFVYWQMFPFNYF